MLDPDVVEGVAGVRSGRSCPVGVLDGVGWLFWVAVAVAAAVVCCMSCRVAVHKERLKRDAEGIERRRCRAAIWIMKLQTVFVDSKLSLDIA